MASSYFEVKETVNDDNVLPFGLEACEENGISLASQSDSDLPKDHTYTKEPDIVVDKSDDEKDEVNDVDENQKPSGRTQRNVKPHKFIKTSNAKDNKSKKDTTGKKDVKTSKRATTKQPKSQAKKDTVNNKKEVATPVQEEEESKPEETHEVENGTIEEAPEQSKSRRRNANKRKIEEKENIAEEEPPASDVALIENSIVGKKVKKSKPVRKNTPQATPTPKKQKVPVKEEKKVVKKVTKDKSASSKGNVTEDNAGLPKGWTRKIVVRQSGRTAGQVDVYIYNPEGLKFRSRPDVAAYLVRTKSNLKLESFNFSKNIMTEKLKTTNAPAKKNKTQPAKSKDKKNKLVEKKLAPTVTTTKRSQKLVVKLKFSPNKRNTKKTKRGTAASNTPKISKMTKAGSQRSNRKTK